jgi:Tol biopolymer transport system component
LWKANATVTVALQSKLSDYHKGLLSVALHSSPLQNLSTLLMDLPPGTDYILYMSLKRIFATGRMKGVYKAAHSFTRIFSLFLALLMLGIFSTSCSTGMQRGMLNTDVGDHSPGLIAFTGMDGNMYTIHPSTGKLNAITDDAAVSETIRREYRYPAWSFNGQKLAFVGYNSFDGESIESTLYSVQADGSDLSALYRSRDITPFYLYWSPDNRNISFLSSSNSGPGLVLQITAIDNKQTVTIGTGQPYYWAWSPDGSRILTHTGGSGTEGPGNAQIEIFQFATGNIQGDRLTYVPAQFQAPEYSPDGRYFAIAAEVFHGLNTLILFSSDGSPLQMVADWNGPVTFSWSPEGRHLGYVKGRNFFLGGIIGSLSILDIGSEGIPIDYQIDSENILAYFWSPDGRMIATFEPQISIDEEGEQILLLELSVLSVRTGDLQYVTSFRPTRAFLRQILPFYDQYQRSSTIWSPDNSTVVINAETKDARPGIFTVPILGNGKPRMIAFGIFPQWSWR